MHSYNFFARNQKNSRDVNLNFIEIAGTVIDRCLPKCVEISY